MTATEVLQRRDEQLRLMGPMVARLQTELLGPLIERSFAIMWRNGLLPAPPPSISGAPWKVEYLSPLALAQRASDAEATMRTLQAVAGLMQIDPKAANRVDTDAALRHLADRYGAPAPILRSKDDAAALDEAQDAAAAEANGVAAAQGVATAAKDGAGAIAALNGMGQGAPA
jgi:hypothetical protein